jgi:hypothetical protein
MLLFDLENGRGFKDRPENPLEFRYGLFGFSRAFRRFPL